MKNFNKFSDNGAQKKYRQKITVEIDLFSNEEIDFDCVEKIADSFTNFVRQIWCLLDPKVDFACNSTVRVQSPQYKSYEQVKLPSTNAKKPANVTKTKNE